MNLKYLLLLLTLCNSVWLSAADGTTNSAFLGTGGLGPVTGFWYSGGSSPNGTRGISIAMQGSKILISNMFGAFPGTIRITRLNANGTLDSSFGSSGVVSVNTAFFSSVITVGPSEPFGMVVLSDNSILLGCTLDVNTAGVRRCAVVKLTPTGTRDTTFNPGPTFNTQYGGSVPGVWYITSTSAFTGNSGARSLKVQSDGKIVIGAFLNNGTNNLAIIRLNADGTFDTTFNSGSVAPNGVIPGIWYKADASSAAQTAYFAGGTLTGGILAVAIQSNGAIVVAASLISTSPAINRAGLIRLTSTGKLDETFNPAPGNATYGGEIPGYYVLLAGSGSFSTASMVTVAVDSSDRVIAGGWTYYAGSGTNLCAFVMRLTPTGVLDTANFNASPSGTGYGGSDPGFWVLTSGAAVATTLSICAALVIDPAGRIIFTGEMANGVTPGQKLGTTRLLSTGVLDTTFNPNPPGSGLYGGAVPGIYYFPTTTGSPWASFMIAGSLTTGGTGQIVLIGSGINGSSNFQVAASIIDKIGILQDTASPFNTSLNGLILTTTIDQAGKVVAGGYYGTNGMALRYTSTAGRDGSGATNFGVNGVRLLTSLAVTSSLNKIINAASDTYLATGQSNNVFTTLKLTSGGALDTSFNTNGYVIETAITGTCAGYDMLLNGASLAVSGVTQTTSPSVLNYNSSTGARDTSVGVSGYQQFPALGTGVIYGISTTTGTTKYGAGQGTSGNTAFVRALINATGLLQDTASPFNTGLNGLILTTTIDQAGKIVAGGYYGTNAMALRYTNTAGRDGSATNFGTNGVALLTSLATTSSLNKIMNAASDTYLATGQSNNVFTTLKLTSGGVLDTGFNTNGYVVETAITGTCAGYDMLLNGTALAVAGVTNTSTPSVVNYNSSTGARSTTIGISGLQQFTKLGTGAIYGIQTTTSVTPYGAGQGNNLAFVQLLIDGNGLLQDTAAPFNTGANGIMYGGIIDNAGNLVLCGNYNNIFTVIRYTNVGARDVTFGPSNNGVVQYAPLNAANGYAVTQDSSGSYYVAAESTVSGNLTFTVVKYSNTGVLDTTFGNGGIIQETVLGIGKASAIKINSDGTVIVGGQTTVNGVLLPTLITYTATGARLSTFGTNGVQTFSNFGTGTLNDLTIISISTVAAAGQMGSVATLVEFGQSSDLLAQLNNGF